MPKYFRKLPATCNRSSTQRHYRKGRVTRYFILLPLRVRVINARQSIQHTLQTKQARNCPNIPLHLRNQNDKTRFTKTPKPRSERNEILKKVSFNLMKQTKRDPATPLLNSMNQKQLHQQRY